MNVTVANSAGTDARAADWEICDLNVTLGKAKVNCFAQLQNLRSVHFEQMKHVDDSVDTLN